MGGIAEYSYVGILFLGGVDLIKFTDYILQIFFIRKGEGVKYKGDRANKLGTKWEYHACYVFGVF